MLTLNGGMSLTVSGNITIVPPATGTVDNTLDINAGSVSCTSLITSNSVNNSLRSIVSISTGTLLCNANFAMANNAARNQLVFSGAGVLQITGNGNNYRRRTVYSFYRNN